MSSTWNVGLNATRETYEAMLINYGFSPSGPMSDDRIFQQHGFVLNKFFPVSIYLNGKMPTTGSSRSALVMWLLCSPNSTLRGFYLGHIKSLIQDTSKDIVKKLEGD